MKIGLIRHFRVLHPYPKKKLIGTNELLQWFKDYDKAQVEITKVDLVGEEWKYCFSSDLDRALQTAKHIYPGVIFKRSELREIPITPFRRKLLLPFLVWAMVVRLSWLLDKDMKKEIARIKEGINKLLDEVLAQKGDTLIVSHGALIMFIAKELKRRGFSGPPLRNPQNGKVYIYDNEE